MARMLDIKVGAWVAFNTLPDAVWFEVLDIKGWCLTLREAPGYASQTMDRSLVKQVREGKTNGQ